MKSVRFTFISGLVLLCHIQVRCPFQKLTNVQCHTILLRYIYCALSHDLNKILVSVEVFYRVWCARIGTLVHIFNSFDTSMIFCHLAKMAHSQGLKIGPFEPIPLTPCQHVQNPFWPLMWLKVDLTDLRGYHAFTGYYRLVITLLLWSISNYQVQNLKM